MGPCSLQKCTLVYGTSWKAGRFPYGRGMSGAAVWMFQQLGWQSQGQCESKHLRNLRRWRPLNMENRGFP